MNKSGVSLGNGTWELSACILFFFSYLIFVSVSSIVLCFPFHVSYIFSLRSLSLSSLVFYLFIPYIFLPLFSLASSSFSSIVFFLHLPFSVFSFFHILSFPPSPVYLLFCLLSLNLVILFSGLCFISSNCLLQYSFSFSLFSFSSSPFSLRLY